MNVLLRAVLTVAFAFAASAPGGAQYIPDGSYRQSCVNIRTYGPTLSASCTAPNGRYIDSSINVQSCRGSDIANRNGYLACSGYNGGGGGGAYYPPHGGGGSGYNPPPGSWRTPPGSYQSSCRNAYMNGGTLVASCTATNGAWITSSLPVNRCRPGTDIANINGRLECLY